MMELILRADKSLLTNASEFVYGEDGGIVKIKVAKGIYPTHAPGLTKRVTGVKLYIHDVESGATATVDCEYDSSVSFPDKNFDIYLSNPITAAITTAGKRFILWLGVSVKDTYTTYSSDPTEEGIVTYRRAVIKSHPIGITVIGVPDADGGLNGKGLELMVQWNLRLEDAKAYMERAEKAAANAEKTAVNTPKIIEGNWWTYDKETGAYVDTGLSARGDKGDKGEQGIRGVGIERSYYQPNIDGSGSRICFVDTEGIEHNFQVLNGKDGEQGIQGVQGEKGDKGDKGEKGDRGDKGDKGDKGEQGIQGEKGDKGDSIEVLQNIGQSTTAVMSQNATTAEINAIKSDLADITVTNINGVIVKNVEYNLYVKATEVSTWEAFLSDTGLSIIKGFRTIYSSDTISYETNLRYNSVKIPVKSGDLIRFKLMPYYFLTSPNGINFLFIHNSSTDTWTNIRIGFGDNATNYDILYSDLAENGFTVPESIDYLIADIYWNYYLLDGTLISKDVAYGDTDHPTFISEIITKNMEPSYTAYDGLKRASHYVPATGDAYYEVEDDLRIPRYETALGNIETVLSEVVGGDE